MSAVATEDLVGLINADNLISVMLESAANREIIQKYAAKMLGKRPDLDAGTLMWTSQWEKFKTVVGDGSLDGEF